MIKNPITSSDLKKINSVSILEMKDGKCVSTKIYEIKTYKNYEILCDEKLTDLKEEHLVELINENIKKENAVILF